MAFIYTVRLGSVYTHVLIRVSPNAGYQYHFMTVTVMCIFTVQEPLKYCQSDRYTGVRFYDGSGQDLIIYLDV